MLFPQPSALSSSPTPTGVSCPLKGRLLSVLELGNTGKVVSSMCLSFHACFRPVRWRRAVRRGGEIRPALEAP